MDREWKEQYDYMLQAERNQFDYTNNAQNDQYMQYYQMVNNANLESAQRQMDFQRSMSSTAHQREVKDLIAAGLNPVLSANNGASSPAGAYANVDSSPISAKFASQNLQKELANARTIAQWNNNNALQIAREQMVNNYEIAKYQADTAAEAQKYGTDHSKYGWLTNVVNGIADVVMHAAGVKDIDELKKIIEEYLGNYIQHLDINGVLDNDTSNTTYGWKDVINKVVPKFGTGFTPLRTDVGYNPRTVFNGNSKPYNWFDSVASQKRIDRGRQNRQQHHDPRHKTLFQKQSRIHYNWRYQYK